MLADNPQLVRKVRAAITAKIKPTSMVLMEDPTKPWRLLDFQLIEALQTLQDEICPQCGNPVWLCRSKSPDLSWKITPEVCKASARVDEYNWRKDNSKKQPTREDRESWGRIIHAVPQMIEYPGEETPPMPTREDFYKALAVE